MNKLILALLLTFSLGASAQYNHRSNPGDLNIAPAVITSVGAGNCPGSGCVVIATGGAATAHATISGTYVATLAFYGSNDNFVTLVPLLGYPMTGGVPGTGVAALLSGATGTWVVPTLGFRAVAVYGATWASNASMGIRLDADPVQAITKQTATTTATAPTSGSLTAATSTTVYAGAAGICQVAVSNLSATIAMTCGQGTTSLTQGLYVPALGTYTTSYGYGGQVQCFPASGTPAYSVQTVVCP